MNAKQRRKRRREHDRMWGMDATSCRACNGTGMVGGVEWLPARAFVDARTGQAQASSAGFGFVSRACAACNRTGRKDGIEPEGA